MERSEIERITMECLLRKSKDGAFYQRTLQEYSGLALDNRPVSPLELHDVNKRNDNVVISEDVYRQMAEIQDITLETDFEIPFFLIGWEKSDGSIVLDRIISDKTQRNRGSCDYDNVADDCGKYLLSLRRDDFSSKGNLIICKGHSHGKSPVSDNFSFGDMKNYVTFKSQIREFVGRYNKNGVDPRMIDTTGMLLNPCGDFNMVYYDDRPLNIGFYKFNNLKIKTNSGDEIPLPTMSEDGNYIKNQNRIIR